MAAEYGKVCCYALKNQNISVTVTSAAVTSRVATIITTTTTTKVDTVMAVIIKVNQETNHLETKETRIINQNRAKGPQMVIQSRTRSRR